jgi:ribose transport system substrate-binding protein
MTTTMRRLGVATLAAAALLTTAACGSGDSGAAGKTDGKSDGKYKIGLVHFSSTDVFSEAIFSNYKKYAEKQGWSVTDINPEGSADKAISGMNDLVSKKVDLIVTETFPSNTLTAGIRAAKAAGIPVASVGGGIVDGVVANQDFGYDSGKPSADLLVKNLGGKGDVLVFAYSGAVACANREKAFEDAIKGTSIKITVQEVPVPGQVEAGQRFAQAFLSRHPAGSGPLAIWGCWDDPAVGAVNTLKQNHRDDITVYGINGAPNALKAVESGDMSATTYTDPVAAGEEFAAKAPDFIKGGVDGKPVTLPVPIFLVTKDTLGEFNQKYPGVMPK